MDFLIREVCSEQGQIAYQDTEVCAEKITIGSSPDQLIQLRGKSVAREHAVLKFSNERLSISGVNNNKICVNGKMLSRKSLDIGDELVLDNHKINIVRAPAGFDAACELIIRESAEDISLESMYVTSLSDTFLGTRAPSYLLSLFVVMLVLVWPLSTYMSRKTELVDTNELQESKTIKQRLAEKAQAGGADVLWSSGPLLAAHQLEIGDDCSACHKSAFQKVQDSACLDCHQSTADHFKKDTHPEFFSRVDSCQRCHKEHNEPQMMVVESDSLCIDCHQGAIALNDPGVDQVEPISGFDVDTHAPFKLEFLLPEITEKGTGVGVNWYRKLIRADSEQKEVSNLKFPHDLHLDKDKVQSLDSGDAMLCSDCHQLNSDNEHFEAITMERHCSQCHDLSFNVADPDRQLPHGNPRSVIQSIEEHFVRVYTDPNFRGEGKERRRRRPGLEVSVDRCDDTAFSCAIERATIEAGIQFTQRGCVTCHEVSDNGSNDLYSRWTVLPVKINHDWYARAHFDHLSHLTQQGESENQVCSSCHKAASSTESSDVLIPNIDNCLSCHGDQSVEEKVSVNCVSCHAFHPQPAKI